MIAESAEEVDMLLNLLCKNFTPPKTDKNIDIL